MAKANHLIVALIKAPYVNFADIVDPAARAVDIDDVGTVYLENSQPVTPDWVRDFFGNTLNDPAIRLQSSNAKAVLLVRVPYQGANRIFAVLFGFGRFLLNDNVIEERFGLKVVLNSVDHQHLRGMDKTSLGSAPKQSREQMSRESEVADFGLDIEQDLVSSVTGRSRFADLGKTISGRDTLAVTVKFDVTNIKNFLTVCLGRYFNDEYKPNFGWIDQIQAVRDSGLTNVLDGLIAARMTAAQFDKIWMAPPDIIDWVNISGFRYRMPKRGTINSDLHIADLCGALAGEPITVDRLSDTPIHLISAADGDPIEHWSAYKCLCAEVTHNGLVYVLNNGKWYEIANDFAQQVKDDFISVPECALNFPVYNHANEGAYNDSLPAHIPNSFVMDRKLISYGGGASSIEFCDLGAGERLIHIKRYSGSSQLSHLFAQGLVSSELFLQDANFRKRLNVKLPRGHKLANSAIRPVAADYEIVFAVISKSPNPLDIPFFSKVTLRNTRRRLETYGYRVTKKKIQHA